MAKATIAIAGAVTLAAISTYKDIKLSANALTTAAALSLILTFMHGFWLAMYVLCMFNHRILKTWQYILYVLLVSFNGLCLMCTNVLLLAIINHRYALLAIPVVLVPFMIAKLAYLGRQMNNANQQDGNQDLKITIRNCSYVANFSAPAAFSMQLAIIFEYFRNPKLRDNPLPSIDLSVNFLASIMGLLSMMVTAMPLDNLPTDWRPRLVLLVKFLRNSMLILTAAAAMTLGGEFLDGLVLLAVFPMIMFGVVYMTALVFKEDLLPTRNPEIVVQPEIPPIFTTGTVTCILLLSMAYTLYTGDKNVDGYLRVGILCLVAVIASSLSLIALFHRMTPWANIHLVLTGIFLGFQILTASVFLLKIFIDLFS